MESIDSTRELAADPGPDLELRAELLRELASCTSPVPGSPLPAPGPFPSDPPCR
ncbi:MULTISPECIES: hypothetical protein [unclassified Kitasatospora]|uniref:hypothetical protein n=1 Tax=unclassified Kitasatospora TaxID=2633591 RepID=UPI003816CDDD